jgi:hypothetical protein
MGALETAIGNVGGKVKVPPLYKVRIMGRKAEGVPYNSRPVLHGCKE